MARRRFAAELARYGPECQQAGRPTVHQAQLYCRRLARTHYENFTVASRLLPRDLQQHFCNIYAYCRWADDLADETESAQRSLQLLDWWQQQLEDCYAGRAGHPVFLALRETISQFDIPNAPFRNLLSAFRQDQQQNRYARFDQLLDYCRNSANPVGHLVLYINRCHNAENVRLSDSICTGLQLANFWQDVARDYRRGRIYLPQDSCQRFGCNEAALAQGAASGAVRRLLAFEVDRAEQYLTAGWPLVDRVPRQLQFPVQLFIRGGLAILQQIRKARYDVWTRRPIVGRTRKIGLMLSAWLGKPGPAAARQAGP